jgi:elongation factor Ts
VEISCETDFVARTDDFKALSKDISMQVAAMSPRFVKRDEITEEQWSELEREFGDRESAAKAVVLGEQDFIKDAKKTIGSLVTDAIAKLGENIVIRRFARFELGETTNAK